MIGAALQAEVTIYGEPAVVAGYPPFAVHAAGEKHWMVTGRDGGNCVAFPSGLRVVFDIHGAAIWLCQELNQRAAS